MVKKKAILKKNRSKVFALSELKSGNTNQSHVSFNEYEIPQALCIQRSTVKINVSCLLVTGLKWQTYTIGMTARHTNIV